MDDITKRNIALGVAFIKAILSSPLLWPAFTIQLLIVIVWGFPTLAAAKALEYLSKSFNFLWESWERFNEWQIEMIMPVARKELRDRYKENLKAIYEKYPYEELS